MNKHVLRLYITGRTPRADAAIFTLRRLLAEGLDDDEYTLSIIDVLERPQLAEDEKILATPTLVKELPPPIRRIIGDLSDVEKVLIGLDIQPQRSRRMEEADEHDE